MSSQLSISQLTEQNQKIAYIVEKLDWFIAFIMAMAVIVISMVIIQARTIHRLKAAESQLSLKNKIYSNIADAVLITDHQHHIQDMNEEFCRSGGYQREAVLGRSEQQFFSDRYDQTFLEHLYQTVDKSNHWKGELWCQHHNGEEQPKLTTISAVRNASGEIIHYISVFSDISELKSTESKLHQLAHYDVLTDLPNRSMFQFNLERAIAEASQQQKLLAVIFIDLDHFKYVNDNLGHDIGDQLLKEAASRLKGAIRKTDILSRFGGDEFTLCLTQLEQPKDIEHPVSTILNVMAEPFRINEHNIYISASIGITLYPQDANNAEVLLKYADQAMYAAKNEGRNRFHFFTPKMQENALQRLSLSNELRTALSEGQFYMCYQPIIDMSNGRWVKAEALIRWKNPERGEVSPAIFINVAEENGMIGGISEWVFQTVSHQLLDWRDKGNLALQISINSSPLQYKKDQQLSNWIEQLKTMGLPGQSLLIEITEGLLLDANETVRGTLLNFRDADIQVAIDDFGTGYSSLAYLKEFDIDYIKIDQAFVQNLTPDSQEVALCEAMIVMAHKLGIQVVAEGIETVEQHQLLRQAGCDFGQGYYYSKPIVAEEFERLLALH